MAITSNVPSDNFEDLQRDVRDATKWVNGQEPFPNRAGEIIKPIPVIQQEWDQAATGQFVQQTQGLVAQAEGFASQAETAAEAAAATGKIYETSAAGQADAGLVDGDYFWVVSADDSEVLELWRKGASSPTDTGKRTPSMAATWGRGNLSDRFDFVGTITSGDLIATATKTGVYLATTPANHADAPASASESLLIEVSTAYNNEDWVHQAAREYGNPQNCWIRRVRISTGQATSWGPVSGKDIVITTNKIAEKAVTRSLLADTFMYNDSLPSGDLLSSVTKEGYYYIADGDNHADAPYSGAMVLECYRPIAGTRYLHQTVRLFNPGNDSAAWFRRVDTTGSGTTDWKKISGNLHVVRGDIALGAVSINEIADNSILHRHMFESWQYAGVLDNVPLNQARKPGLYLVLPTCTDLPTDFSQSSGLLEIVGQASNEFMLQRFIGNSRADTKWVRVCRPSANNYGEWVYDGKEEILPSPDNRLVGKTIVFLGDSITATYGMPENVGINLSGSNVINFGIGGTRIANHPSAGWEDLSGWVIATAINTGDWTTVLAGANHPDVATGRQYIPDRMLAASQLDWNTVDYIVLGYGTNDFSGTPIGATNSTNTAEFCGGINVTIEQILSAYPHIRLMFWTPIWKKRTQTHPTGIVGGSDVSPNNNGDFLIEFVDAMIEVCNIKHQEVLDLQRTSGIYQTTEDQYILDGVHPTIDGSKLLADKITGALQSKF